MTKGQMLRRAKARIVGYLNYYAITDNSKRCGDVGKPLVRFCEGPGNNWMFIIWEAPVYSTRIFEFPSGKFDSPIDPSLCSGSAASLRYE